MCSVLLVDDDADASDLLAEHLQSYGCQVRVACSGCDALILAEHEAPDVVLLDIVLPDMLGYELAPLLRRVCKRPVRIIAATGLRGPDVPERARRSGCDSFLAKPLRGIDVRVALGLNPMNDPSDGSAS
jgi:CheY-like chemotaxis protein